MAGKKTLNISIKLVNGKGFAEMAAKITALHSQVELGLAELAIRSQNHMRNTIQTEKNNTGRSFAPKLVGAGQRQGPDNLENNIKAEGAGLHWGVGNKAWLLATAPYYQRINDGGYIPPANLGSFPSGGPASGGGGEGWTHKGPGKGSFKMTPKKVVKGMNYIEKTGHYLLATWSTFWKSRLKKR